MSESVNLWTVTQAAQFPTDLPEEDGVPLESNWHRIQINLLVELTHQRLAERKDYFAAGNMFVYFSPQQALTHDYRGPDYFLVKAIAPKPKRGSWKVWEEGGRFPNVIVELMSPSTADNDLHTKKELYERTFKTPEYFAYDPDTRQLYGWRLGARGYRPMRPNTQGQLWSAELAVWVGLWLGEQLKETAAWVRFFTEDGHLIPTAEEAQITARFKAEALAELAALQAEQAEVRAEQAESSAEQERAARQQAESNAEQAEVRAEQAAFIAEQERAARQQAEAELTQLRAELARLRGT